MMKQYYELRPAMIIAQAVYLIIYLLVYNIMDWGSYFPALGESLPTVTQYSICFMTIMCVVIAMVFLMNFFKLIMINKSGEVITGVISSLTQDDITITTDKDGETVIIKVGACTYKCGDRVNVKAFGSSCIVQSADIDSNSLIDSEKQ